VTKTIKLVILLGVVFLLSFIPRIYEWRVEGINPDEPTWQKRIENFTSAISKQEWNYTMQSLHPAVTLSWLGSMGRSFVGYNNPHKYSYPFSDPLIFWDVHFAEIFMIILAVSSCLVLVSFLLYQLVGFRLALLASILLALDPFFIANARMLQMDGLLAIFAIVTLLTTLVFRKTSQLKYLILAAIFAGLTVLTKINGVGIIAVGLVLLFWENFWLLITRFKVNLRTLLRSVSLIFVFGIIALATFFILYPAMWVQPLQTVKDLVYGVLSRGLTEGSEAASEVFFFGQVVENPGSIYYPVILGWRLTPLAGIFSVMSLFFVIARFRHSLNKGEWLLFLGNWLLISIFIIEMTVVAKKSERYILPAMLSLNILAGLFLYKVWSLVRGRYLLNLAFFGFCFLLFGQFFLLIRPLDFHYGSYYNPMLGGSASAVNSTTVGWGQGFTEIADYINSQPLAKTLWVAAFYGDSLRPAIIVADIWYPEHWDRGDRGADLVIFYINQIQRQKNASLWREYKNQTPIKTVKINDVVYAYMYKGLKPDADRQKFK